MRHHRPEIILIDLGLPDRDGIALLPKLKRLSDAAILMLTSRDDERGKVAALDGGADDYVTKSFSIPELLAQTRTVLRHCVQERAWRVGLGVVPGQEHHQLRQAQFGTVRLEQLGQLPSAVARARVQRTSRRSIRPTRSPRVTTCHMSPSPSYDAGSSFIAWK